MPEVPISSPASMKNGTAISTKLSTPVNMRCGMRISETLPQTSMAASAARPRQVLGRRVGIADHERAHLDDREERAGGDRQIGPGGADAEHRREWRANGIFGAAC